MKFFRSLPVLLLLAATSLQAQLPLRIAADAAVRKSAFIPDLNNNNASLSFVSGDDVTFEIALFQNGRFLTNLYLYTNLTCQVFTSQNTTNNPLMTQTITNSVGSPWWNTNCTLGGWTSNSLPDTNWQAQFYFPSVQTSFSLNGQASQTYWMRIFATQTNSRIVTFMEGPITIYDGPSNPDYVPPVWSGIAGIGNIFESGVGWIPASTIGGGGGGGTSGTNISVVGTTVNLNPVITFPANGVNTNAIQSAGAVTGAMKFTGAPSNSCTVEIESVTNGSAIAAFRVKNSSGVYNFWVDTNGILFANGGGVTNLSLTALTPAYYSALTNALAVVAAAPSTNIIKQGATISSDYPTAVLPQLLQVGPDGLIHISNTITNPLTFVQQAGHYGGRLWDTNVGQDHETWNFQKGTNTTGIFSLYSKDDTGQDPRGTGSELNFDVLADGTGQFQHVVVPFASGSASSSATYYADEYYESPTSGTINFILPSVSQLDTLHGFAWRGMVDSLYPENMTREIWLYNNGTYAINCYNTNHANFNLGKGLTATNVWVLPGTSAKFLSDGTQFIIGGGPDSLAAGPGGSYDGSLLTNLPGISANSTFNSILVTNPSGVGPQNSSNLLTSTNWTMVESNGVTASLDRGALTLNASNGATALTIHADPLYTTSPLIVGVNGGHVQVNNNGALVSDFGISLGGTASISGAATFGSTENVQGSLTAQAGLAISNGIGSFNTNSHSGFTTTGYTNRDAGNRIERLIGLTGTGVQWTNLTVHIGVNYGTITSPINFTLNTNEGVYGTSMAVLTNIDF
jgi:hypothetical protein